MLMDVKEGLKNLKEQERQIPEIERKAVVGLVREMTMPLNLRDGLFDTAVTRFTDVCDHLRVVFVFPVPGEVPDLTIVEDDGLSKIVVEEHKIAKSQVETNNLFGPKVDEVITLIKIRDDLSLAELGKLIKTIRELSKSPLWSGKDQQQADEWQEGVREYSSNLRWAGLAMMEVQKQANGKQAKETSDFDDFYRKSVEIVFKLGQAIDLDRRNGSVPTLDEACEELKRNKTDEYGEALQQGLQYARYAGKSKRQLEFADMARLYQRVKKNKRIAC
ncbi:hypothetical protein KKC08_05295 [Patescibacteria group bacterium]|nr:hypothetical protein [Patescibacteria group bacterium]MCG2702217.1 hypothetical protein [Candidatus Parcubacteria bacterium]MBU4264769.1 hypothetical protein [Patescibacteria group bacterium]MBU4390107.1 hypothetical protein [Patescibacteria group bacterium]MBU4397553.1 hypothetical protein [Patescibacteria group bacterium]